MRDSVPAGCRNHKLTMLMSDSLGGSAKTLMFVNVSPTDYNIDESSNSLTYATRVRTIKNDISKNEASKDVMRLKRQVSSILCSTLCIFLQHISSLSHDYHCNVHLLCNMHIHCQCNQHCKCTYTCTAWVGNCFPIQLNIMAVLWSCVTHGLLAHCYHAFNMASSSYHVYAGLSLACTVWWDSPVIAPGGYVCRCPIC